MYRVYSANGFKLGEFGDLEDALTALHAWPQAELLYGSQGQLLKRKQ